MKSKRLKFIVDVPLPEGATPARLRDYVREAVGSWGGQFAPVGGIPDETEGDPLGPGSALLEPGAVRVSYLKPKRRTS